MPAILSTEYYVAVQKTSGILGEGKSTGPGERELFFM